MECPKSESTATLIEYTENADGMDFGELEEILSDALEICDNYEWGDTQWKTAVLHAHVATASIAKRLKNASDPWHIYASTLRMAIERACLYANVYAYVLDEAPFKGLAKEAVNNEIFDICGDTAASFCEAAELIDKDVALWRSFARRNHPNRPRRR